MELNGRVALVTGGGSGIGRASARRLVAEGMRVCVVDVNGDAAKAVADEVGGVAATADVSDPAQVKAAVAQIEADLGPIDILVNNAGGDIAAEGGKPKHNDALSISLEDLRAVLDRNLMTTLHCCRAVVPGMIARKRGKVINIGTVNAFRAGIDQATYATAKAAQAHYTRCLAAQVREHNITINMVAPGGSITGRFIATGQARQEMLDAMNNPTLLRYADPDEIACAVQFFASPLAGFVSGQILRVDGGAQLSPA
jgi:3-oxoacyl-[acyl-carrier protein] reductase